VEGTGERRVNPWNDPRRVAHPEGMREIDLLYSPIISHPSAKTQVPYATRAAQLTVR
jgi:hypothetical protein